MKNNFFIIIAIISILSTKYSYAQIYIAPPVKISKEIIKKADGKEFYYHIVEEKQTLYSICKAYNISTEELYQANPNLDRSRSIKAGEGLLIPKHKLSHHNETAKQQVETSRAENKTIQLVKKVEDNKDIKKLENIPYIEHKVSWFEDINDIAIKYNIPAEYILKFNNIKSSDIKSRMILKIPQDIKAFNKLLKQSKRTKEKHIENNIEDDNTISKQGSTINEISNIFNWKKTANIVLYLPFASESDANPDYLDFYNGSLLAIKDNAQKDLELQLTVLDSKKSDYNQLGRTKNAKLFIGPVNMPELKECLYNIHHQYIVSPLDPRAHTLAKEYNNFIQIPPASEAQYSCLINWIKEDYRIGEKVINIYQNDKDNASVSYFNNIIHSANIPVKDFAYNIIDGRTIGKTLDNLLDNNSINRIILNSENEAFINDILRNLNILKHKKYQIEIYGLSKIRTFETIDINFLHQLKAHITSSYFIDYNSKAVNKFILSYRALYNAEPSQFAFQGYDIMNYFINLFATYGNDWIYHLEEEKGFYLQSNFDFYRYNHSGYINKGIRKILYDQDYGIKLIYK